MTRNYDTYPNSDVFIKCPYCGNRDLCTLSGCVGSDRGKTIRKEKIEKLVAEHKCIICQTKHKQGDELHFFTDNPTWLYCAKCHHEYKNLEVEFNNLIEKVEKFWVNIPETIEWEDAIVQGHCPDNWTATNLVKQNEKLNEVEREIERLETELNNVKYGLNCYYVCDDNIDKLAKEIENLKSEKLLTDFLSLLFKEQKYRKFKNKILSTPKRNRVSMWEQAIEQIKSNITTEQYRKLVKLMKGENENPDNNGSARFRQLKKEILEAEDSLPFDHENIKLEQGLNLITQQEAQELNFLLVNKEQELKQKNRKPQDKKKKEWMDSFRKLETEIANNGGVEEEKIDMLDSWQNELNNCFADKVEELRNLNEEFKQETVYNEDPLANQISSNSRFTQGEKRSSKKLLKKLIVAESLTKQGKFIQSVLDNLKKIDKNSRAWVFINQNGRIDQAISNLEKLQINDNPSNDNNLLFWGGLATIGIVSVFVILLLISKNRKRRSN